MCFSKCVQYTPWYGFYDVWKISPMPSDWFLSNREIFSHLALVNSWLSPDWQASATALSRPPWSWLWPSGQRLWYQISLSYYMHLNFQRMQHIWLFHGLYWYYAPWSICLLWCRLWTFPVHLLTSDQAFRTWLGPLWIPPSFSLCEFWLWFSNFKIKLMNCLCENQFAFSFKIFLAIFKRCTSQR